MRSAPASWTQLLLIAGDKQPSVIAATFGALAHRSTVRGNVWEVPGNVWEVRRKCRRKLFWKRSEVPVKCLGSLREMPCGWVGVLREGSIEACGHGGKHASNNIANA